MRNKMKAVSGNHNIKIKAANMASNPLNVIDEKFRKYATKDGVSLKISCVHSSQLKPEQLEFITSLTEETMKNHYEKSENGWNRKQKEKEFKHETARILLVENEADSKLVAFVHFRFELDDQQKNPVVYCYEIQMPVEWQNRGLGRHLMSALYAIGERFKMFKVMITCFKHNESAIAFYKKLGYIIDICSPSRCGDDSKSYEIMNLRIRSADGSGDA